MHCINNFIMNAKSPDAMTFMISFIKKHLSSCCYCHAGKTPDELYQYSSCTHLFCEKCSNGFEHCRTCGVAHSNTVKTALKKDHDLSKVIQSVLSLTVNENETLNDLADNDLGVFKKSFDLLYEQLVKTEEPYYTITDRLRKRVSKLGVDDNDQSPQRTPLIHNQKVAKRKKGKSSGSPTFCVTPAKSCLNSSSASPSTTHPKSKKFKPNSRLQNNLKTPSNKSAADMPDSPLLKNILKINSKGENTLQVAIRQKKDLIAKQLIDAGVNVNHQDFAGWTPLHEAVNGGMVGIAELLLKEGAVVNAAGLENKTALRLAVEDGQTEMINLLLSYGADPDAKDLYGRTPRNFSQTELKSEFDVKAENEPSVFFEAVIFPFNKRQLGVELGLIRDFAQTFKVQAEERNIQKANYVIVANNAALLEFDWNLAQVLAKGAFIVTSKWCEDSLSTGFIKEPDDYEIRPAWMPGLHLARRNALMIRPGLFSGLTFFIGGGKLTSVQFQGASIELADLKNFIQLCGGRILYRAPDPEDVISLPTVPWHAPPGPLEKCSRIMIDLPPDYSLEPKYQMQHLKVLPITWLMDSILAFKLIDNLTCYQNDH